MRLFIALPVSGRAKEEFMKIQEKLKNIDESAPVKWTDKDQCHITVEFLGEVAENEIRRLQSVVDKAVRDFNSLDFSFHKIEAFPSWHNPNVLVLQINDLSGASSLQSTLSQKLEESGFTVSDRKWKPHLTLGRIKGNVHWLKDLQNTLVPLVKWTVTRVELIESQLSSNGPKYFLIKDFKLK